MYRVIRQTKTCKEMNDMSKLNLNIALDEPETLWKAACLTQYIPLKAVNSS
jgi:hypothetical protein